MENFKWTSHGTCKCTPSQSSETLSPRLLFRTVKINIYRNIVVPFRILVSHIKERAQIQGGREHVVDNEVTADWRQLHNEEHHDLYLHRKGVLLGWTKNGGGDCSNSEGKGG